LVLYKGESSGLFGGVLVMSWWNDCEAEKDELLACRSPIVPTPNVDLKYMTVIQTQGNHEATECAGAGVYKLSCKNSFTLSC